jgi:ribosomal protein S18 acetylase RimI-like enzyme
MASVCEPILRALPEWFGIEESNARYIKNIDVMPTLVAFVGDKAVGFLTIKEHNVYTAEILVMGVLPEMHRKGAGRALVREAEKILQKGGTEYLQVKTLSSSDPDEHYAATRKFYFAMGFRLLEDFGTLWDEEYPCLLMVKYLLGDQI